MAPLKYRRVLAIGITVKFGGSVVCTRAEAIAVKTLAVHRDDQAEIRSEIGAQPVHLDLDTVETVRKAVVGVDYIVHIGASKADATEVAH